VTTLADQLRWVHDHLRRDLESVTRTAEHVRDGLPVDETATRIRSWATTSPIWALRMNCLSYCRVVHLHHTLESAHLFPALRGSSPELGPVLERLEDEHGTVAREINQVEAAVEALGGDDGPVERERVVAALRALAADLLAHLDYEEEHLVPVLTDWTA